MAAHRSSRSLTGAAANARNRQAVGRPPETAAELTAELRHMAWWLGLERVEIVPAGDLAPALAVVA